MDLILWRHCDAEPGVPDDARRLTPRGRKQAVRMAAWLDGHLPGACRIVVSPAVRAQQTAQALARPFETVPEIGTETSVAAVLAAANWPHAAEAVLVVGHQPTLGCVASFLLTGDEADRPMAKGAVFWLSGRASGETTESVLRAAVDPDSV
jgi:phosphohistidine phosphatase